MHGPDAARSGQTRREANEQATVGTASGKGHGVRKRQQVSQEALENHAADVALAAKFDELLAAARQAELDFRRAEEVPPPS